MKAKRSATNTADKPAIPAINITDLKTKVEAAGCSRVLALIARRPGHVDLVCYPCPSDPVEQQAMFDAITGVLKAENLSHKPPRVFEETPPSIIVYGVHLPPTSDPRPPTSSPTPPTSEK